MDNTVKTATKQPTGVPFTKDDPRINRDGRPKGSGISITTEIKKKLAEIPEGQKVTYLQLLISRIMKQAIQDGDQQMIKQIWNYVDGLPVAKTILAGDEQEPLVIITHEDNAK
jgi:hypothetical protein